MTGTVYPGDVIWTLGGTTVERMPRDHIYRLLHSGRAQLAASVVPLSPLRSQQRLHISKLRESTLTDANSITCPTAAEAYEESG
ncbi:hypothetical protein MRX96_058808 [Rhipicephalus microplus]